MPSPSILSRVPVLRILLPLMAGIIMHEVCHCLWVPVSLLAASVIGYWLLSKQSKTPQAQLRYRPFFIVPLAVIALSLGWLTAIVHCPPTLSAHQMSGRLLTGRVTGLEYTDFSMRMTIDVLESDLPRCRVLVTTRGCDYTARPGDIVTWPAALQDVRNTGNPDEMDYARLMLHNEGIRYEQHLPASQVKRTGHSPTPTTRLAQARRTLANKVFNSSVSPGAQHFIVALLLGDSHHIDKETRLRFSSAGIAHVLALSGLHVGLIALIISCLLFPLDYLGLKKLRLVLTMCAIVLFAAFTGFSPSVVRATVMTGFAFAALILYRRSVSLNALLMAALVILVFSPADLFNTGFQLSFITVGALLLFARVPRRLRSGKRWIDYLTTTLIASLVAMLATIPLNAHYFHTVSLMSVITNVLVLALMPPFMVMGAVFVLVCASGMQWPALDAGIDAIYRYIDAVAQWVNAIPLSHVGGVYVSTTGVILYFVIMGLIVVWLYKRSTRYLLLAGIMVIVMLGHSAWVDWHTSHRGLVVFNSFTSTPVLYYDGRQGYVWIPDQEESDMAEFERHHMGFLARHNIQQLSLVRHDTTLQLEGALFKPPYAHLMGRRLLAVGRGRWKSSTASTRLPLDDIIVTKRYRGTARKLKELYRFDRLIISGAQQDRSTRALLGECDSLGVSTHVLASQGAIVMSQ